MQGEADHPPMFEIQVMLPHTAAVRLSDALAAADHPDAVATGLFETPDGGWSVFAHYHGRPDEDALLALFRACDAGDPPKPAEIEQQDWVARSQAVLAPVKAGRFVIHGGHDRTKVKGRRNAIEIDAGQAFGTAHHATTAGCLQALEHVLRARKPRRVLDLGTGSGILAIAAAKASASALGIDNDPIAVGVARENARHNRMTRHTRFVVADGLDHPWVRRRSFDLIFANILAGPLFRLAPSIRRAARPGSHLILSGITTDQSRATEARYRAHGFLLLRRLIIGHWAILLMRRR